MRRLAIAAALAAALAIPAARAVTPEVRAERAAGAAAQADYVAARDKAKKDYAVTKAHCNRLAVEVRSDCVAEAKTLKKRALDQARTNYNLSVAKAKTKTKGA